jgi:hypothetical protein
VLVNLREHLEVGVPHQFLDRHQVDAFENGVSSKRVPDGVGTDVEVHLFPQPPTTVRKCPTFPDPSFAVAKEGSFCVGHCFGDRHSGGWKVAVERVKSKVEARLPSTAVSLCPLQARAVTVAMHRRGTL